ncbi:hypothetical protein AB0B85_32855 [Micromonospora sp. NPDC049044]|uniref:hypothetical protein n=1 Tax=Micromonospora sp. NPDC049044 TaxID=3154827 RepID=UPI0033D5B743
MAEVTMWIEEDGKRVTFTAEHANKAAALLKAQNFIEKELEDAEVDRLEWERLLRLIRR